VKVKEVDMEISVECVCVCVCVWVREREKGQRTSLLNDLSAATSAQDLLANWMKAQLPFDAIVIDRISPY